MFYELYFKTRSYLVTGLLDNGWENTLSFLQMIGRLNAIYAVATFGLLSERVKRFSKLRAEGSASEQDKNCFAEGLLTQDAVGRNAIATAAATIVWSPHAVHVMLRDLDSIGFFVGKEAAVRLSYFLQALFAGDLKGQSAFLSLLESNSSNLLSLVLSKLLAHADFTKAHQENFIYLITKKNHFVFRKAAENLSSYSLIRQALLKAGYTSEQLANLLNTTRSEMVFEKEIQCTPLMLLIYNTIHHSPHNYADFVALMVRFRADGAQLTSKQAQTMRQHLEEIKGIIAISPTQVALFNDYITSLQSFEKAEPPMVVAPQANPEAKLQDRTNIESPQPEPEVEDFAMEDAEVLRVLNLV